MKWKDAVRNAIKRRCRAKRSDIFTRSDLICDEIDQIISDTNCKGDTPEQTLSRVLQELRKNGEIEFVDYDGTYRKLCKDV